MTVVPAMKKTAAIASFALWAALGPWTARETCGQAGLLTPTSTGQPDPAVLSLREMAIDVGIARGYARVNVRQVYENHTGDVQEGTYRFALPPSAAVGDFAVWDGLVRIPGVILEKQRARAIYRELTTQRIDPGLLQQGEEDAEAPGEGPASGRPSGGALFSVRVAPIPPWATKRLEMQFQQEVPLVRRQGEFRLALRPPDGEPPVARTLTATVRLEDGEGASPTGALALRREGADLVFAGTDVTLDKDLVVRFSAGEGAPPLSLAAFRNPAGSLPDGVALAPWERPSDVPPEKDGFFLLEALPPGEAGDVGLSEAGAETTAPDPARPPVKLAVLFDTSLSHRWSGLESAYAAVVRVLRSLRPDDRFALIPFDRRPVETELRAATPESIEQALQGLRSRPLGPATDLPLAVAAGRRAAGDGGRILLLTDGQGGVTGRSLDEARGPLPLFTIVTGLETAEALRSASAQVLASTATEVESRLFFERMLAPVEPAAPTAARGKAEPAPVPFQIKGGEPRIRDVYPVMVQPPAPGSLSGWVGRYGAPAQDVRFEMASPLFEAGQAILTAALPETALLARDLPRRWARARVDHLLMLIEAEGERREWIEEIIALSKRYKFVTPYTAFLAAPRSLLRPRRIQPGDPVLRVECDAGVQSAVALFPFGLRLPLVRRPGTRLWEGRFLVPEGLADGRYAVRILLRDTSGARLTEVKHFVLDGRAPVITPEALPAVHPGDRVRVAARADEDVIVLQARLADGAPVPLRWDAKARRSVGELRVPGTAAGRQEVVFEAVDAAKNVSFARAVLEVRP
jgi:Ca-activated chloride channel family protein